MMLLILLILVIFYICIRIFISRKSDSLTCLVGKTALVTGGNSGLGYATSTLLASRGCRVIIADRDNAEKTIEEIKKITHNEQIVFKYLDLSSLKCTREFVEDLKKTENKIDILINNAGLGLSKKLSTEDGLNTVMQINYFGAFLLTHLLLDLLKASGSARILFLGSLSIFTSNLTMKNLNYIKLNKNETRVNLYSNSKLCCVLAAQEFGSKLKEFGITSNSVDPGIVKTDIFRRAASICPSWRFQLATGLVLSIFGVDSFGGAQTIFDMATSDKFLGVTSKHYSYLLPFFKPSILKNQKFCDDVWQKTEELVNLAANEKIQ